MPDQTVTELGAPIGRPALKGKKLGESYRQVIINIERYECTLGKLKLISCLGLIMQTGLQCVRADPSHGQVLSSPQVIEIYKHKLRLLRPSTFESCLQSAESRIKGQSVPVASLFGVSPKTVRDIWNRRTWAHATNFLWDHEESSKLEGAPGGGSKVVRTLNKFCYMST